MKNILVTQRSDYLKKRKQLNDSIDQRLANFVIKSGFRPILVPNVNYKSFLKWIRYLDFSGILLSGGGVIGSKENLNRDKIETKLITLSLKKKIPLFSICRGMQMVGFNLGVTLKKVKNHVGLKHKIYLESKKITVNSFHDYSLVECPKNFKVLSRSEDGNIESIIHNQLKIYGCMWHPEREKIFRPYDLKMFKKIFQ